MGRRDEARSDGLQRGWVRYTVQAPSDLVRGFTVAAGEYGHGGIKTLSAVALGLSLGMPDDVRDRLYDYVLVRSRRPEEITPEGLWRELIEALANSDRGAWYIDRILDPEASRSDDESGAGPEKKAS